MFFYITKVMKRKIDQVYSIEVVIFLKQRPGSFASTKQLKVVDS